MLCITAGLQRGPPMAVLGPPMRPPGGFMSQGPPHPMPPGPPPPKKMPPKDDEPPAKKARTEESLVPEDTFLAQNKVCFLIDFV